MIEYYVYIHTSKFQDIVIGVYNGYKVILQVIAMVLAFLTRKVKVKGLDDSKYIAAIVYITSIVLAVLIVSEYTINEFVDAYAVIVSTGIIVDSTCILGLVFIPKVFRLKLLLGPPLLLQFNGLFVTHFASSMFWP